MKSPTQVDVFALNKLQELLHEGIVEDMDVRSDLAKFSKGELINLICHDHGIGDGTSEESVLKSGDKIPFDGTNAKKARVLLKHEFERLDGSMDSLLEALSAKAGGMSPLDDVRLADNVIKHVNITRHRVWSILSSLEDLEHLAHDNLVAA